MTSRWRYAPFIFIVAGAITGNIHAGILHLNPTTPAVYTLIAGIAVGLEGGAVWMAYMARIRAMLGESIMRPFAISSVFAALAIAVNIGGHWGDWLLAATFGGLSAAGYVIWIIDLLTQLDDAWDPDGRMRMRVPGMRILTRLQPDPKVATVARRIALRHAAAHRDAPGMTPTEALDAAEALLAEQERRRALMSAVRDVYRANNADDVTINLALLTLGEDHLFEQLVAGADTSGMAEALLSKISPRRLTGAVAGTPVRRERVTAAASAQVDGNTPDGGNTVRPGTPGTPEPVRQDIPSAPDGGNSVRPDTVPQGLDRELVLETAYAAHVQAEGESPGARALQRATGVPKSTCADWLRRRRAGEPSRAADHVFVGA